MKKRFIALLLCCVMLLTLSPSLISAASATDISGTPQSTEEQETIGENTDTSSTETSTGSQPDATSGSNPPADPQPDATSGNPTGDNTSDSNPAGNTSDGAENNGSSEAKSGKDPASMTDAELYAYVKQLSTDEEIEAFLKQLPEERVNSLIAYAQAQEPTVVPETVVFTDAGPFMPPVNVAARRMMRAMAATGATADNGLELSKTAVANNDGTYTIRMEAYTTGTVTTSTKTVPVDIVLVLDQSGSMAYDFNGNSTSDITARRQYAMKQAVNNFIDEVAKKYTEEADHRMAIVTFSSEEKNWWGEVTRSAATTLQTWTDVNASGASVLERVVSGLSDNPSGGTQTNAGISMAKTLMESDYSYTGLNTTRQKVVILFTDGVPGNSGFDTDVADAAIDSAKSLKDSGVTVYTVGIFNGANPYELYGASGFDTNSDGTVNSKWIKDTWGLFPGTDFPEADRPAGNRFLNYLSSNCPDAVSVGLERSTKGLGVLHYKITYKITDNFPRTASTYYLTANDSGSLNTIFKTISDNIQAANIDLGSETVVKDTVSPYFDLPANTSDIKLYTAAAKADGNFETAVPASGITATIENNAVSVTGFDFNANFVSKEDKGSGDYGKKLIIEFTVTPKDGFLGGNDVPTNDWANSAVYDKSGTEVEKFADATTTPTVNVPIKTPEFTANNKTIYEGNSISVTDLYTLPTYTGDDAWKAAYVDISGTTGSAVTPDDCTDYTITVTYAPKTKGTQSKGTPNAMTGKSTVQTATVHVLKPTVTATVNDVQAYYGETYTAGTGVTGSITVTWTDQNGHTGIPAASGSAPYTKDNLHLDYSFTNTSASSITVPKSDVDVTVKVMKGSEEITDATITTTCDITGSGCTTPDTDKTYTVHVKTCQLTITKTGGTDGEPYVFNIYKDGSANVYTQVTIVPDGDNRSVTIYELPVGTYTIEEDTGWSWRYPNPTYTSNGKMLSAGSDSGTITCTNLLSKPYWLNGFSTVVENIFGVTRVEQ